MTFRPIRIVGDPVLRTPCSPIDEITPGVKALVEDLVETVELSDGEFQDGEEGCLSVPDLWFPTKRALYARAEGSDLDGRKKVVEGEGLMGRCIQHEVDHLDGHLYIDRLDRETRKKAMRAIRDL